MAPVVNPGADSETGRIRKEAKREKRKRLGKCFCCNVDNVQLHLEAYVNESQIAGKERSKI
jgi:glutaminase